MKKFIRYSKAPKSEQVKVCLIKASQKSSFKDYKKSMMGVPQNIFSVAACSPDYCQIQMIDETIDHKIDWNTDSEIIVIMFHTPSAIRGYKIADKFRKKGKIVVLGGLHVSFMTDEALQHADAVLVGESEGIWEELLEDYKKGSLKRVYKRSETLDLRELKPYPTDIIPTSEYDYSWTVVVSRGCPNKCSYCTVHKFFPNYRKRPIPDVIEEIKNCGTDFIELKADNFMIDRTYALELFKAMEDLDIVWFTALEPNFADDKELVEAAAKSGLRNLMFGIETPSRESLSDQKKSHLDLAKLKSQIDYLHSLDIEIDSAMLFGFDDHDYTIFQRTLDFALDIDIDISHGVIPIPFPGTDLYNRLESEGRITNKDWSKYDGAHLVYTHPTLSKKDIEGGAYWFDVEFQQKHKNRKFKWHDRWYDSLEIKQGGYTMGKPIKWKTLLGITIVLAGIFLNLPILFGLLYILWAIGDIKSGYAYIFEPIVRRENPILYWIITSIWFFSGIWIVGEALLTLL